MTAKEALELYKSRDASEKLFGGDKSYLGNKSMRVYTDESVSAKIFIDSLMDQYKVDKSLFSISVVAEVEDEEDEDDE